MVLITYLTLTTSTAKGFNMSIDIYALEVEMNNEMLEGIFLVEELCLGDEDAEFGTDYDEFKRTILWSSGVELGDAILSGDNKSYPVTGKGVIVAMTSMERKDGDYHSGHCYIEIFQTPNCSEDQLELARKWVKEYQTPKIYLTNAFSLNMLWRLSSVIETEEIQYYDMPYLMKTTPFISAVGHETTAAIFEKQLKVPVLFNRQTVTLYPGDTVYVGQYKGPRLEEGATDLPSGAEIRWAMVTVRAGGYIRNMHNSIEDVERKLRCLRA